MEKRVVRNPGAAVRVRHWPIVALTALSANALTPDVFASLR